MSIQILRKENRKNKLITSVGSATEEADILKLEAKAQQQIQALSRQRSLFLSAQDAAIESYLSTLSNGQIRTIGPELVFGKVYDHIGYAAIKEELFRHLVIARLAFPLSKLKTIDYVYRFQGLRLQADTVYRFLDKLNKELKEEVEKISFRHTQKVLNNELSVVFYDMTTLYFEASDEDDLRKAGFSKDGKHSNPQVYLGLLVGLGGYAIGYEIFEGSIYEGHTLIPALEKIAKKFSLGKPVVVADAGLLSKGNIQALQSGGYEYILGARLKNENKTTTEKILAASLKPGGFFILEKGTSRLIVQYSEKRAHKDKHNRERGLQRLEKRVRSGKLTKEHLNNRGYNKYLKIEGQASVSIDKEKFESDSQWDGLKGYLTNCSQEAALIAENYRSLWHIEKAFRMSKTDLRIRPIYHRLKDRIEAHICLSFVAYTIYKELERVLKKEQFPLSVEKAAELTHTMYQIEIMLPQAKQTKTITLQMDHLQNWLIKIVRKNFDG